MATFLNRYQCPECGHTWRLLASSRTRDDCNDCGLKMCVPRVSREISRLLYTWHCQACKATWEGELRACDCGAPASLIDVAGVRLESAEGNFTVIRENCGALSRTDEQGEHD